MITSRYILSFIFILLFASSMFLPTVADVIWEYTFDENLPENWNVLDGTVSVQNGEMVVTDGTNCLPAIMSTDSCWASIWFEESDFLGTWTFDYFRSDVENSPLFFGLFDMVIHGSSNWTTWESSSIFFVIMPQIGGINILGDYRLGTNINIQPQYSINRSESDT